MQENRAPLASSSPDPQTASLCSLCPYSQPGWLSICVVWPHPFPSCPMNVKDGVASGAQRQTALDPSGMGLKLR